MTLAALLADQVILLDEVGKNLTPRQFLADYGVSANGLISTSVIGVTTLAAVTTAALTTGVLSIFWDSQDTQKLVAYVLKAYSGTGGAGIVMPVDYNITTNARAWFQIL